MALLIATASAFLSEHYQAPAMLFALLIGLALGFLAEQEALSSGLNFTSKQVLRFGVGLLGIQLSYAEVKTLGVVSVSATFGLVVVTLLFGVLLSFINSRRFAYGILSGGAVAVCGASAALAFSAVLPPHPKRESDTILVVIGVTALSTVAMVLYPVLFRELGYSELQIGFLIGATIHDVAQVVGAGYSVSDEAGLFATLVKMLRVACLPVLVMVVHWSFKDSRAAKTPIPWFLLLFLMLAVIRSTLPVPPEIIAFIGNISRWMLMAAIAALGLRTDLAAVLRVHPSLLIILLLETVFILVAAMAFASRSI